MQRSIINILSFVLGSFALVAFTGCDPIDEDPEVTGPEAVEGESDVQDEHPVAKLDRTRAPSPVPRDGADTVTVDPPRPAPTHRRPADEPREPEIVFDLPVTVEGYPIVFCDIADPDCPTGHFCKYVTLADDPDTQTTSCVPVGGTGVVSDAP